MNASTSAKRRRNSAELRTGGLARLSTCDWPGELVATIFTQGCPWSCGYCHNPHLLPVEGQQQIAWADVMAFLQSRRGLLDGVVFSGGEPTLQTALPQAMQQVRALGFKIGLHTAGPYPERLSAVLPQVDWVGFDVKASPGDYARITRAAGSGARAYDSLRRLLSSGVDYEVRTTVHPALLNDAAVLRLQDELRAAGVAAHRIQNFRATGCLDADLLAVEIA